MASEKAIEAATIAFAKATGTAKECMSAALDAAAAVDGDTQWNTAIESAADSISLVKPDVKLFDDDRANEYNRAYWEWKLAQIFIYTIRALKKGPKP